MGKLLIVNGSPRAPRSNSRRYIEQFLPCWGETADQYTALRGGPLSPEDCTDLLLVFPLYADGIPAVLMRTLKELAVWRGTARPRIHVLVNCGFLEPEQTRACGRDGALFLQTIWISLGDGAADRLGRGDLEYAFFLSGAAGPAPPGRWYAGGTERGAVGADAAEQAGCSSGPPAGTGPITARKQHHRRRDADHGDRGRLEISSHKNPTTFADYSWEEVCGMDTQRLWECFCLTGEPLVYLLYQAALDQESGGGISA